MSTILDCKAKNLLKRANKFMQKNFSIARYWALVYQDQFTGWLAVECGAAILFFCQGGGLSGIRMCAAHRVGEIHDLTLPC